MVVIPASDLRSDLDAALRGGEVVLREQNQLNAHAGFARIRERQRPGDSVC